MSQRYLGGKETDWLFVRREGQLILLIVMMTEDESEGDKEECWLVSEIIQGSIIIYLIYIHRSLKIAHELVRK